MTVNISHIRDILKQLPEQPGIYQMLDASNHIIYIGKSKCLKKRVQSYFTNSPKWEKVTRMVSYIHNINYIVTDTHLEARLLECELIKRYKPYFNAQMKNDQRYVYLKLAPFNRYNPFTILAEREDNCFGPFRSKYSLNEFLQKLKNIYPLRKAEDHYDLLPL